MAQNEATIREYQQVILHQYEEAIEFSLHEIILDMIIVYRLYKLTSYTVKQTSHCQVLQRKLVIK